MVSVAGGAISLRGWRAFVYFWKVVHGEFFAPFFAWWNWSVPDDDGIRALHSLESCALGLSDGLLMFLEARKGLPMRVYRWIVCSRVDSLK